jgi:hypothetical protein
MTMKMMMMMMRRKVIKMVVAVRVINMKKVKKLVKAKYEVVKYHFMKIYPLLN